MGPLAISLKPSSRRTFQYLTSFNIMNHLVMQYHVPFLPHDIMVNILKRLPVKSLIRFQCVCKDWKNLINSRSFIEDHLHHFDHQKPSLLIQSFSFTSFESHLVLLDGDMQVRLRHQLPNPTLIYDFSPMIIGSSNGLLCGRMCNPDIDISPHSLSVWNPATKKIIKVCPGRTITDPFAPYLIGFGFSPIDDEYKIVRIYVDDFGFEAISRTVEVYSLNSEAWKKVESRSSQGLRFKSCAYVTVNGSMFWIGEKQGGSGAGAVDGTIISFDLTSNTFESIPMPHFDNGDQKWLMVYENKLAVVASIVNEDKSRLIHLRVKKEDEDGWSEIKKYTRLSNLRNDLDIFNPFHIQHFTKDISSLNLTKDEIKRLDIGGGHVYRVFSYTESLVSVGNISNFDH